MFPNAESSIEELDVYLNKLNDQGGDKVKDIVSDEVDMGKCENEKM